MSLISGSPVSYLAQHLPVYYAASQTILVISAGLLFYVALTDLKDYKVRNEFVALLMLLFFVHAFVSGRWALLPWNLAFAAAGFACLSYVYTWRVLGGGDVKLLTVALLWTGKDAALTFSILLLAFGIIHFIAVKFKFVSTITPDGPARIPYAPSIAAALIGTFVLGCLSP
jgi:Flp pilus assembly protein protease CpaA